MTARKGKKKKKKGKKKKRKRGKKKVFELILGYATAAPVVAH
jgi:hypothetical protein